MLDDGDEAVRADGAIDLYPHGILACTPKFLDFEVLLEPLVEQFHLPSVLVQQGDLK
jgi:hypothetical protein